MSKMLIIAAAAAVAIGGLAGPSFAAGLDATPSQAVSTGKVDFRNEASVKGLYDSLRQAAYTVCGVYSANPRVDRGERACAEKALAEAVHNANRPVLTAVYQRAMPENRALAQGY